MLIELCLASVLSNGYRNFVMLEFVRAVGTSCDCCKVPLAGIFLIYHFLKDVCSLFNIKQVEIQNVS